MRDDNIFFTVLVWALKEVKKGSWSFSTQTSPWAIWTSQHRGGEVPKVTLPRDRKRKLPFSAGLRLGTGTTSLRRCSVHQSSYSIRSDSRKRDINPLLNGRSVKEFVAISNSPPYGVIDSLANLVKFMSPLSRNGHVQRYQAVYWLSVSLNTKNNSDIN